MASGVIAALFPGQGSHTSDLRERVERALPELFEQCIALVGEDPFERIADSTRFAQPAIFCASIAAWSERPGELRPVALAGHSLGELSALVAAGALDLAAGLELAVLRGQLMASASSAENEGMLAVLGASDALLTDLAEEHGVVVANDNAPGQVVLAGTLERLGAASGDARDAGARAIWLDVAGAFHSAAMSGAVEPFRLALAEVEFRTPAMPVICGSTARAFSDPRSELAAAIVEPVRWRETMLALAEIGADTFVDLGPGKILARLVRRNLPGADVLELERPLSASRAEAHGVV